MPEKDERIFREAYDIYNRYRWTEMTEESWMALADDVREYAERHAWRESPLAKRMSFLLMDVFSDLYRGGKKPKIPDYFGREDL